MSVWQDLDRLYESGVDDYDTWDIEDLQAELADLNAWLDEVSGEASQIFYGHDFGKRQGEYDDLQAENRDYEQRRDAVLDALAKKGHGLLGAKAVNTDFLERETPDTQVGEYLTTDGLLTSISMDSSAHSRPDWFSSQAEIDNAIKKFKCSGYHTKAGYNGGTDTFKTFTRDSYKQEQDFYKTPKEQRGQVAMRVKVPNAWGTRSIPKAGNVYFTGDIAEPISEAPHWFTNITEALDLWDKVNCSHLVDRYELDPVYKFLADKYNWSFSTDTKKLDVIEWLRANGHVIRTPEEEQEARAEAKRTLDARIAEVQRISAIKDPEERAAAIQEFRKKF